MYEAKSYGPMFSFSVCPLLDPKESVVHPGPEDGQEALESDLITQVICKIRVVKMRACQGMQQDGAVILKAEF